MKKIRILIVAVCAVFILCSCAGGRMALNAKDASYPVSATQYLHDNNGILTSTYEVLYHFQKDYSRWSILWTAVPFSPYEQNIAADLDSLVPDNPMSVDRLQWEHIQRVLTEHDGNISATARALGMHRRTLQRKLQKRPVRR